MGKNRDNSPENDVFETMEVPKAYLTMAIPVVLGMVVSLVYNMVDTFFIARTGDLNLVAGVSLGAPVFTLMVAMGDLFGLGGSSVMSRCFGRHDDDTGRRISVFTWYGSIVWGIVVAAVMLIFRTPILYLLGASEDTFTYTSQYYTVIAVGAPAIIASLVPHNELRSEGYSVESTKGTVLGTVVNIILDPILILGLGLGATGAAAATVIGYFCSDVYFVSFIVRKSRKLSVSLKGFHITVQEVLPVFSIGLPSSITNLVQSFGQTVTNRFLVPYGTNSVAAMGIAMKVNMITLMIMIGFAFGGQALMGYNYGSGNQKRLKEIMKFAYLTECGMGLVLAVVLTAAAPLLIGLFVSDTAVIAEGALMLRRLQLGMVFTGFVLVSTCFFQSAGKSLQALTLSASRQGVIFVIVMAIASHAAGYYGVLSAQPISDLLTAVLAAVLMAQLFRKGLPQVQEAQ